MMRNIADGEEFQIPSTIDDEAIIEEIETVLKNAKIGYFK
jgi:propionyl-CoA synthetase